MFEPSRLPVPDELGFFFHPDIPDTEEGESIVEPLAILGFECSFVEFEGDAPEALTDAYLESGEPDVTHWAPTKPDGDGWILAAKYDTEGGPWAMFVRPSKTVPEPVAAEAAQE